MTALEAIAMLYLAQNEASPLFFSDEVEMMAVLPDFEEDDRGRLLVDESLLVIEEWVEINGLP